MQEVGQTLISLKTRCYPCKLRPFCSRFDNQNTQFETQSRLNMSFSGLSRLGVARLDVSQPIHQTNSQTLGTA